MKPFISVVVVLVNIFDVFAPILELCVAFVACHHKLLFLNLAFFYNPHLILQTATPKRYIT